MHSMGRGADESIPSLLQRPRSAVRKEVPASATQPPPQAMKPKGKLFKGTPFDYKKGNLEEKAKIAELSVKKIV